MGISEKSTGLFTEINVTPLTDVFLVLLVIMILVAPLANSSVLNIESVKRDNFDRPGKGSADINVLVGKDGMVKINDHDSVPADSLTIAELLKREQSRLGKNDLSISLASDADALQKHVVAVLDAAAGAGIKRVQTIPCINH